MSLSEALMFNGIVPPPEGSNRTTCPECSHQRRKDTDRCLSVFTEGNRVEWVCRHCGYDGKDRIQ
jgi:rubredoxin